MFFFKGGSGCWSTHLECIGLISTCSSTLVFPYSLYRYIAISLIALAPVLLGFSQGLLSLYAWSFLSYTCQRSNQASSPIPVWSHHFCGSSPRPLATEPLQLCHPAQPWLPELAACVTVSLPMKHLGSHLPVSELTTSTAISPCSQIHLWTCCLFWSQLWPFCTVISWYQLTYMYILIYLQ